MLMRRWRRGRRWVVGGREEGIRGALHTHTHTHTPSRYKDDRGHKAHSAMNWMDGDAKSETWKSRRRRRRRRCRRGRRGRR